MQLSCKVWCRSNARPSHARSECAMALPVPAVSDSLERAWLVDPAKYAILCAWADGGTHRAVSATPQWCPSLVKRAVTKAQCVITVISQSIHGTGAQYAFICLQVSICLAGLKGHMNIKFVASWHNVTMQNDRASFQAEAKADNHCMQTS